MFSDKPDGITTSWVMHLKKIVTDAGNLSLPSGSAWLGLCVVFSTAPAFADDASTTLQIDTFRHLSTPAASGPHDFAQVIGHTRQTVVRADDTLHTIARRSGVGLGELQLANPDLELWLPAAGSQVNLPTRHILPDALHSQEKTRTSVVVNLPEFRLYLLKNQRVMTYPVSIGRSGFATPLLVSRVTQKRRDPVWRPTVSIRQEAQRRGETLAKEIPPGPDNPLGKFAIRLGSSAYLIHGTNRPSGLGLRVSHGCVRMFPADIEHVYSQVAQGDRVIIVNEPVKVGWHDGRLWMEVHPPLDEFPLDDEELLSHALDLAFTELLRQSDNLPGQLPDADTEPLYNTQVWLDDEAVRDAVLRKNGIAIQVSASQVSSGRQTDSRAAGIQPAASGIQ